MRRQTAETVWTTTFSKNLIANSHRMGPLAIESLLPGPPQRLLRKQSNLLLLLPTVGELLLAFEISLGTSRTILAILRSTMPPMPMVVGEMVMGATLVLAETAMVAELPLSHSTMPIQACRRQCQGMAIMQERILVYALHRLLHHMPNHMPREVHLSMEEESSIATLEAMAVETGSPWPAMHVQRMLLEPLLQHRSSHLHVNSREQATAFACHGFSPRASCFLDGGCYQNTAILCCEHL